MLINLSNHPSKYWDKNQFEAAAKYGEIIDMPFPSITADTDENGISELADKYLQRLSELMALDDAVMIQGEFTFTYALVSRLKKEGFTVICACADRDVVDRVDSKGQMVKEVRFNFVRFRNY